MAEHVAYTDNTKVRFLPGPSLFGKRRDNKTCIVIQLIIYNPAFPCFLMDRTEHENSPIEAKIQEIMQIIDEIKSIAQKNTKPAIPY